MEQATSESLAGSGIDEAACRAELSRLEARAQKIETPCGDGQMVWRVWGEGKPLVLAHGSQGSWTHWLRNIEGLSRTRRVIVPDFPGHGDSASASAYDIVTNGAITAQGLKQVLGRLEAVDLVGFSYGGICLAQLARMEPGLARRVIMIGTGGFDTPVGPIRLTRVRGLSGRERADAHRQNLLGLMLHDPASVDDMAIYVNEITTAACRVKMSEYQVMPDFAFQALRGTQTHVDVIWGEFDLAHPDPAYQLRALRRVVPDATMQVIANAGHWAIYERPEQFNEVLTAMLAQPLRVAR